MPVSADGIVQCASPREAVALIAAGEPEAVLVVPGWLSAGWSRNQVFWKVRNAALGRDGVPVHLRWIWLREDEDGQRTTGFLVWPCTMLHRELFQCRNGRVFHGNSRVDLGPVAHPPFAVLARRADSL